MTQNKHRRAKWSVTGLLGLGVAGVLAVSLLGFLGRMHWAIDLFSHFRVQYLVVAGVVLALCLVFRWWKLAVGAAAAVAVNAAMILPLYRSPTPIAAAQATPLTVASVNLQYTNHQADTIKNFLNRTDADVVVLIELSYWHEEALQNMDTPYRLVLAEPADHAFGIGVMVRDPLPDAITIEDIRSRMIGRGHATRLAAEVDLSIDGTPVRLLGIHPPPPMRDWAWQSRNDILASTARIAAKRDRPLIVVGDLNITPWSPAFSDMLEAGDLHNTQRGFGVQGTWPLNGKLPFTIPIDHCVVTDDWAVLDRRVGPETGSDHLPLTVTLALRAPEFAAGSGLAQRD